MIRFWNFLKKLALVSMANFFHVGLFTADFDGELEVVLLYLHEKTVIYFILFLPIKPCRITRRMGTIV